MQFYLFSWLYWTYRSFCKVLLRKITQLCELQRICNGSGPGATRSLRVEFSLKHSKQPRIKNMILLLSQLCEQKKLRVNIRESFKEFVTVVLVSKDINPKTNIEFVKSLSRCIEHVWGYEQLVYEVKHFTRMPFNSEDNSHEEMLFRLWTLLMPHIELEGRISKQWQEIGFQGTDPKTDFRGMGMLGLNNLLFFAEEYNSSARLALQRSIHPTKGYAFAILGINITSMAFSLLFDGCAKSHFYNISRRMPMIDSFHHFYCYLFIEFDKFWLESNPDSIMDFINVRSQYEKVIRSKLKDESCILTVKKVR